VSPGRIPQTPVVVKTRRKPLKTDRLFVFSVWRKNALFSAGNPLAENGNSLGHPMHKPPTAFTARGLHCKHPSKSRHSASGNRKEL